MKGVWSEGRKGVIKKKKEGALLHRRKIWGKLHSKKTGAGGKGGKKASGKKKGGKNSNPESEKRKEKKRGKIREGDCSVHLSGPPVPLGKSLVLGERAVCNMEGLLHSGREFLGKRSLVGAKEGI